MNLQRYKWPVVVAAGLHGALFVSFQDTTRAIRPPDRPGVLIPWPLPDPVTAPPSEDTKEEHHEVSPMPRGTPRPEIPDDMRPAKDPKFPLPLDPSSPNAPREITKIGPIGMPDGIGPGEWNRTRPPIATAAMLDRVPNAKVQIAPDYPAAMRHDGIEGSVTVEFEVSATGSVVSARVVRSTHREFEPPALRAVWKWRFAPGRRFGRAVPFRMTIPIEFSITAN